MSQSARAAPPKLQSPSDDYMQRRRDLHQRQQSMSGSSLSASILPSASSASNLETVGRESPECVTPHRQSAYVPYAKNWDEADNNGEAESGEPVGDLASDIPSRKDIYAAQFAALDSALRLDRDQDESDSLEPSVALPDAKPKDESASPSNSKPGLVMPTRRVKASARLGDNVVQFRPGNRFVTFETLNSQLRTSRCKHCDQTGVLTIEPAPEERRGFFIILAALMPMFFGPKFATRLKLGCSRCQSTSWAVFYIEEIAQLQATVNVK